METYEGRNRVLRAPDLNDSSRRVRNESASLAGATCVTGSMLSAHDGPHLEICNGLQTIFGDDAAGLSTYVEGSNDAPTLTIFSPTDRVGAIPDGLTLPARAGTFLRVPARV